MSSEELEMDSDTTIPYPIEEDRVPTETPPVGAPAPEDRPPAPKRRKRRRKRKKGGCGPPAAKRGGPPPSPPPPPPAAGRGRNNR